jgi:hypothetical protein
MKKLKITAKLVVMFILLAVLVFTTMAVAQRLVPGGAANAGKGEWVVMTYVPDNNYSVPVPLPVTPIRGGGVSFDFYPTPDRAMLVVDDLSLIQQFRGGNLTGKTLSAKIAIEATPGASFIYFNNDGTGTLQDGWADPGGFVRLYFNKVNTVGCPTGWHPERPDCEAQYWWSNPVHIDLADLAARGGKEITLEVPLNPEFWSDRDGHMGTDVGEVSGMYIDHRLFFAQAVANVKKIGLSFGGNGWWAFGCGVEAPSTATFMLYKFMVKGN